MNLFVIAHNTVAETPREGGERESCEALLVRGSSLVMFSELEMRLDFQFLCALGAWREKTQNRASISANAHSLLIQHQIISINVQLSPAKSLCGDQFTHAIPLGAIEVFVSGLF